MIKINLSTFQNIRGYHATYGTARTIAHAVTSLVALARGKSPTELAHSLMSLFAAHDSRQAFYHQPLVSIIICNYNGARHLDKLANSLQRQRYRNFEIIFVDNGSTDGSSELFERHFPFATIIRLNHNVGFSMANNIALEKATGELIALLNNDTEPTDSWLFELIETLRADKKVACAVPKILFNGKFSTATINSTHPVTLCLDALNDSLCYKKYFIGIAEGSVSGKFEITSSITISLPQQATPIAITLSNPGNVPALVSVVRDFDTQLVITCPPNQTITGQLDNGSNAVKSWHHVINNAGSISDSLLTPSDRGYGHQDSSIYDKQMSVPYLCGCAPLLSRKFLRAEKLFYDEFFAYYEDSELSHRLRRNGGNIVYQPRSVIFHTHSATANVGSQWRANLIDRNRIVFRYLALPAIFRGLYLNYLESKMLRSQLPAGNEKTLCNWTQASHPKLTGDKVADAVHTIKSLRPIRRTAQRVCIYNDYWMTLGGGEAHALEFFRVLADEDSEITLASKNYFNKDYLARYFDADLSRATTLINPDFGSKDTADFDLFINSTFHSKLIPRAKTSFYIVSFPSKRVGRKFKHSYYFLFNSRFTKSWAQEYWGAVDGTVITPVVNDRFLSESESQKNNIILNIGRFSNRGHKKNQDVIIRAFIEFSRQRKNSDWQLQLIGSLEHANEQDKSYFARLHELAANHNIKILCNVAIEGVAEALSSAKIYVHGAGFEEAADRTNNPELTEHYGMTIAESMSNGCIPIVHNSGNPPYLLREHSCGATYDTFDELVAAFNSAAAGHLKPAPKECRNRFSRARLRSDFREALSSHSLASTKFLRKKS